MTTTAADRLMRQAIEARHFHSATLLVALEGQPLIHQAYGQGRIDTVYDLASLTKPLATTAVLMQLVTEGRLSLDRRVDDVLPSLGRGPSGRLRLDDLLDHSAGLEAWAPFFEQVVDRPQSLRRSAVRRIAAALPLAGQPRAQTIYSDLGFILLDWVIQRATGERLDHLAQRMIYGPLGLERTGFIDLSRPSYRQALQRRWPFAPTERCPWRGRRLVAEVHDDNCHAMGGISGHAGLFSCAHDVHLLVRELVAAYHGRRSIFDPDVVRLFLDHRSPAPDSERALGWDRPAASASAAGQRFGPRSVGHLGFTGTSLWIDLDRRLWVILLTNRVYYGREPNPMKRFRPRLHDALLAGLGRAA